MDGLAVEVPLAIAVLAGGASSRMGYNKSFALLDGEYMLVHTLRALDVVSVRHQNAPLFIVANDQAAYQQFGRPLVSDVLPGRSSINGLYSALWHSPAQYTLCVACDMPFLKPALLTVLIEAAHTVQAVVPRVDGHLEALCAIYAKTCLEPLKAAILADTLKIQTALASLQTRFIEAEELRRVDPDLTSFVNINTQTELDRRNTKPRSS